MRFWNNKVIMNTTKYDNNDNEEAKSVKSGI